MRRVLFLDYDGVLHPDAVVRLRREGIVLRAPGHSMFESAAVLDALLEPHPQVEVVLSTSWVAILSFLQAKQRLPPRLQSRVTGATFHRRACWRDDWLAMSRWSQIEAYVTRHGLQHWLALDDNAEGWPKEQRRRLVSCDPTLGLSHELTQSALADALKELSK